MIRRATTNDVPAIAGINRLSFSGNKPEGVAEKWVTAHLAQGDQYQYFVYEKDGRVLAYIGWEVKGGFARSVPVLELEQIAVHPEYRGQGVGRELLLQSFEEMKLWIKGRQIGATQVKVFVWTKKANEMAQSLYAEICNDPIIHTRNVYNADEVMMTGTHVL